MERIISFIMVLILVLLLFFLNLNFEIRITKLETRLESLCGMTQGLEREIEPLNKGGESDGKTETRDF